MSVNSEIDKIRALLCETMLRDRDVISRTLKRLKDPAKQLPGLKKRLYSSIERKVKRARNTPNISYPQELPITSRREEIIKAIRDNQVVIIAGETGSGKSTQIPKMCMEAERGIFGLIGCTQPRRIAASTISQRIAEELGETLGKSVGYKIRFTDRTNEDVRIKVMTDGILLAETRSDRMLYEYDTLIIDEAHERSLNIDFLLGIIRTILPERPDLKVIITSATIDTERFSKAFGGAPVIEVSGRMFPVDVKYEPLDPDLEEDGEITYVDMAVKSVEEIRRRDRRGDILVFMPTEQDILETCERLEGRAYDNTTVLPLFARLPAFQQQRVYSADGSKIVVATNVAETSLTIPGIKYVIDTGLARISRYHSSTRTNSLPISPVSKSSAEQRKGRCGRVQNGICIRLYSEEDFENRAEFTPPEILRSNLAEVILRMIDLDLGDPEKFPFIDPPSRRSIKDGFDLLEELGAIEKKRGKFFLTKNGRLMARMPMDPRISRMMIEAEQQGVTREVAVIAGALSIQDPRERPPEKAGQADQMHAPFKDSDSDFITLLNIWNRYHREWVRLKTQNRMRKFCREHYLSFIRMREWIYTHDQIMNILGIKNGLKPEDLSQEGTDRYMKIHCAILSGFLSNIALLKEKNLYRAARGREVMIFPGSTLFNRKKEWIVAAEMVKTSRLYARTVARIDSEWLEPVGGTLCKKSYGNAHWEKNRGEVRAHEKVSLYGLPIVAGRPVSFSKIDPAVSHEIFVRSALVEGDIKPDFRFIEHNKNLLNRLKDMEHKLRRRDLVAEEDVLAAFYSSRLEGVCDTRTLARTIKQRGGDDFLLMEENDLILAMPGEDELRLFPDEIKIGENLFSISYCFSPGDEADGVTIRIPSSMALQLPAVPIERGIEGQLREKIEAYIRGLPKRYRKQLVPVSEKVDVIIREMKQEGESLITCLSRFVYERFSANIPAEIWESVAIPDYLRTRISIIDHEGREVKSGRDLFSLLKGHRVESPDSDSWNRARLKFEKANVLEWSFEELPEKIEVESGIYAYPGLKDDGDSASLRIFPDRDQALESHLKGVARLLTLRLEGDIKFLKRRWPFPQEEAKAAMFFGGQTEVEVMMVQSTLNRLFQRDIRSAGEFDEYAGLLTGEILERYRDLREKCMAVLRAYDHARLKINSIESSSSLSAVREICANIRQEMEKLVPPDFPEKYDIKRLKEMPRYLQTMEIRAERGSHNPEKERQKAQQVNEFAALLSDIQKGLSSRSSREKRQETDEFRWMVEEFRVSIFAPELGTAFPVSAKRLKKKADELTRMV